VCPHCCWTTHSSRRRHWILFTPPAADETRPSSCVMSVEQCELAIKLEFHATDTGTNTDTDILAETWRVRRARKSACPVTSPFSLPRAGHTRTRILADLSDTHVSSRGSSRVYTCTRVLFTISYRVPIYKTRSIWKMLGPFATASHYIAIHQVSLLLHAATVVCRLRIDVHDDDDDNDNDNAWQRGPLWPHGMGPITRYAYP